MHSTEKMDKVGYNRNVYIYFKNAGKFNHKRGLTHVYSTRHKKKSDLSQLLRTSIE